MVTMELHNLNAENGSIQTLKHFITAHQKDSILGTATPDMKYQLYNQAKQIIQQFQDPDNKKDDVIDKDLSEDRSPGVISSKRSHLKRKAQVMKNSKYDDNFLVDYSGNQNKVRKIDDSGKSSGTGKFDSENQVSKRSSKRQQKLL